MSHVSRMTLSYLCSILYLAHHSYSDPTISGGTWGILMSHQVISAKPRIITVCSNHAVIPVSNPAEVLIWISPFRNSSPKSINRHVNNPMGIESNAIRKITRVGRNWKCKHCLRSNWCFFYPYLISQQRPKEPGHQAPGIFRHLTWSQDIHQQWRPWQ